MQQQGIVVFAKNKKRVSAFYQRTLGLEVLECEASHDLLRGQGCEVVVHAIPRRIAAGIVIGKPPQRREQTPIKPSFVVASLAQVRQAAEATGGGLGPQEAAWRFRGHVVIDGWDPEGNVVQFKQAQEPAL
jgi:predicted enzyme related to lactoylglutathione lyase